jgi:hypothetical protein
MSVGATYKFVTSSLQDKLGVVEAKIYVEFTTNLVRELAKRKIEFQILSNELYIRSNLSWDYRDAITELLRKAAIEKIARETKNIDSIVTEFRVKLDVSDVDFAEIDKLYNEELEKEKEREKRKNLFAEVKAILKDLEEQGIVSDLQDLGDYVKAEFIDGTRLDYSLRSDLENAVKSLKNLNKEQILLRVIEKLRKEIKELEKERAELREKILEEIANAGSFTLKREKEITYRVEEEDEN